MARSQHLQWETFPDHKPADAANLEQLQSFGMRRFLLDMGDGEYLVAAWHNKRFIGPRTGKVIEHAIETFALITPAP